MTISYIESSSVSLPSRDLGVRASVGLPEAIKSHRPNLLTRLAGIEELRTKREEIDTQITEEEDEKAKVQSDLQVLSKRLTTLNESIARKLAARNDYDKTIQETEAAYLKILESSQTLLTVLKRESAGLEKKSTGPGAV